MSFGRELGRKKRGRENGKTYLKGQERWQVMSMKKR
jgi:hypothetical protein